MKPQDFTIALTCPHCGKTEPKHQLSKEDFGNDVSTTICNICDDFIDIPKHIIAILRGEPLPPEIKDFRKIVLM